MSIKQFDWDLDEMDTESLKKISQVAVKTQNALLAGMASIRQMDKNLSPEEKANTDNIVRELGLLTLVWNELLDRVNLLLIHEESPGDGPGYKTSSKPN
ncbi:MAG: hypothetical protein H7832_01755 [Magnetococcus sp. DMHC-6]